MLLRSDPEELAKMVKKVEKWILLSKWKRVGYTALAGVKRKWFFNAFFWKVLRNFSSSAKQDPVQKGKLDNYPENGAHALGPKNKPPSLFRNPKIPCALEALGRMRGRGWEIEESGAS